MLRQPSRKRGPSGLSPNHSRGPRTRIHRYTSRNLPSSDEDDESIGSLDDVQNVQPLSQTRYWWQDLDLRPSEKAPASLQSESSTDEESDTSSAHAAADQQANAMISDIIEFHDIEPRTEEYGGSGADDPWADEDMRIDDRPDLNDVAQPEEPPTIPSKTSPLAPPCSKSGAASSGSIAGSERAAVRSSGRSLAEIVASSDESSDSSGLETDDETDLARRERFAELKQAGNIVRMTPSLWAFRRPTKPNVWDHLWGRLDCGSHVWSCDCALYSKISTCPSVRLAQASATQDRLLAMRPIDDKCEAQGRIPHAILLAARHGMGGKKIYWVSVVRGANRTQESSNKRGIVTLTYSSDRLPPESHCSLCARRRIKGCEHRDLAQHQIVRALSLQTTSTLRPREDTPPSETAAADTIMASGRGRRDRAESNMPRRAPRWAVHSEDVRLAHGTDYQPSEDCEWRTLMIKGQPMTLRVLRLDRHAACTCSYKPVPGQDTVWKTGVIYGLTAPSDAMIECTKCMNNDCPRAVRTHKKRGGIRDRSYWITGDFRAQKLFSVGSGLVFTHEILDSYLAHMITMATPFSAFHAMTSLLHEASDPMAKFVSAKTFASAFRRYMAFNDIVRNMNDMKCSICGDDPEVVIVDGYAAGYDKTSVSGNLRAPTRADPGIVFPDVKAPTKGLQYVSDYHLRLRLLTAFVGQVKDKEKALPSADMFQEDLARLSRVICPEDLARRRHREQATLNASLTVLQRYLEYLAGMTEHQWQTDLEIRPHRDFIIQLLGPGSILSFITSEAAKRLEKWCIAARNRPQEMRTDQAVRYREALAQHQSFFEKDCPVLGTLCSIYAASGKRVLPFERLLHDISKRTLSAFEMLKNGREAAPPTPEAFAPIDSLRTGSVYGQQYRKRPTYSSLRHDQRSDSSKKNSAASRRVDNNEASTEANDGDQDAYDERHCQKFYDEYRKAGLTGGMLLVWCNHLVCYGFHFIETSEGRNDIFTALYCFFRRAPRVVVYDFACALGPYCMQREPDYFKKTLFLIDELHAKSHTKCTSNAFVSKYMAHHKEVRHINTSAAEVANACLKRIRTSVSYSNERNAIALARIFVLTWNCQRQRHNANNTTRATSRARCKPRATFKQSNIVALSKGTVQRFQPGSSDDEAGCFSAQSSEHASASDSEEDTLVDDPVEEAARQEGMVERNRIELMQLSRTPSPNT